MANERKSRPGDGPGVNKPGPKRPAARPSHVRGGLLDLDSEQSARLLIFGGVGLIVAVAAAFLIFGYWYSVIRPRNRTVLQVADQQVSYSAMKRRMSYEFLQNTAYQSQQGIQALPAVAFQTLLNELTEITQAGPKLASRLTKLKPTQSFAQRSAWLWTPTGGGSLMPCVPPWTRPVSKNLSIG